MSAGSKTQRAGAVAVLATVALGLGLLGWAYVELEGRYGPSYGARLGDGTVVLASHGHLHVFQDEKRVARISFKALGLGAMVTDLDAAADSTILVADADSRSLRLCRLDARSCAAFYDGSAYPEGAPRKAFKAAIEPGSGRVVVSDSSNHRLLLLDAQGRPRHATPRNGPLFTFPNGVVFLTDGSLAVADTDHRRIAYLRVAGDRLVADGRELRISRVFPGSDPLHPIDIVAEPGGRLWAILASNSLETGVVVSMQSDGGKPRYAPLPQPADPLSLVALADAMLVLEPTIFRVTRIALVDGSTAPFGDAAFQNELRGEALWRSRLLYARQAAQALLVLALIAALVIAVRSGTLRVFPQLRPRWNIPQTPAALAGGVDWIQANPLPGRAGLYGYLSISLLAALGLYLWMQSAVKGDTRYWLQVQLMIALVLLLSVLSFLLMRRLSGGRLGTDGETLFVQDAGRTLQAPLAEVLYSNTRLLVGTQLVALRLPAGDRYPSERVAGSILARLPASAKVGELRLSWLCLVRALGRKRSRS